jgi:predicted permease
MEQFFSNFLTVFMQVLVLFVLMGFGFAGNKAKLITKEGSKVMSDVVLYFVTPCLIINSFSSMEMDKEHLNGLIVCFAAFFLIMAASILLVHIIFRGKNVQKKRVLRFAVVFSNVGYMGIPLQEAVLGQEGVFYGSVCVGMFNILVWTYGIVCSSGDLKDLSIKKILFNPGILAVTVGLIIFLFSIPVKEYLPPVSQTLSLMAGLNTPIAMMVIGFNLAGSDIFTSLKSASTYIVAALRLILVPVASLFVMLLFGIRGDILVSIVIAASAPVAAVTTVFAIKYDNDVNTSVNLVAFTTLLSIITMPFIVALAQIFQ